jgi:hypothetical protein
MRARLAIAGLVLACACGLAQAQQTEPQWLNVGGISAGGPSPRQNAAMAPADSGAVVLFGGKDATTDLCDTWLWTDKGWTLSLTICLETSPGDLLTSQ